MPDAEFSNFVTNIILTFALMVIGIGLTPSIANLTQDASDSLTGIASTLMFLIPVIWVLIILSLVVLAIKWEGFWGN